MGGYEISMESRLEQFENMLASIQSQYAATVQKMEMLRQNGKEKSATFRQLMGDKLLFQNMLSLYRIYNLLDEDAKG